MKRIMYVFFSIAILPPVSSAELGSHEFCLNLANVGKNAFKAKSSGYSLSEVLNSFSTIFTEPSKEKTAAEGVILVVYGDSSIKNSDSAFEIVYDTCRK